MKILLDTNVVVDVLAKRHPFFQAAAAVFELDAARQIEIYLTANALTDIYYLLRKSIGESRARSNVAKLMDLFHILPVLGVDCKLAIQSENPDFEDALMEVCAKKADINYIILFPAMANS